MESLSYGYEGRGLLLNDDTDFQIDDSRNLLKKWDGEHFSIPTRDAVESMGFIEPVLPDMAKRSVLSNQFLEVSDDDPNNLCGNSLLSISTAKSNSINEFGMRFSSSFDKANDEKLTLQTDLNGSQFSLDKLVLSSPGPSRSAKRARIMSLQSQLPTCQVHGCEKDLSSSKEYHRRHKVCDAHSKTAVVIVNGIQQRFCQQCSRFHVLAEFDEGKRSCRKRLACHNQRRRKPQFHTHLGSTYFMTDAAKMSMLLSRIVPGDLFDRKSNELMNHSRCLNLEEEPTQRAVTMKLDQSLPTVLDLHGTAREEHPSKICPNTPLSVPELSMGSNLSCALSLLSAQSQNSLAGMSTIHENHCANLSALQSSSKSLDKSASENFSPSFLNSPALPDHRVPVAPQAAVSVGSGILGNELSLESDDALNLSSYGPSPEGVNTIDLRELSLHLQRVEQQKYYAQVKLDTASSAVPQLQEEDM